MNKKIALLMLTLCALPTVAARKKGGKNPPPQKSLETRIIQRKKIQLFRTILDRIIMSPYLQKDPYFQKKFQSKRSLSPKQWKAKWRKILGHDLSLLDERTKHEILALIKEKKLFSLKKILKNKVDEKKIDQLLKTSVGTKMLHHQEGDELHIAEDQTLEEALAKKAIGLIKSIMEMDENMGHFKKTFEELNELVQEQEKSITPPEGQVHNATQEVVEEKKPIQGSEKQPKKSGQIYYILLSILLLLIALLGIRYLRKKK